MKFLLLVALWCGSCAWSQDPRNAAWGEKLALERAGRTDVLDDGVVTAYLLGIVEKLAPNCPGATVSAVRLIRSEEINGFSYPGGFLFVHTGLIRKAESEAELAGVLAHLIAHSAAPAAVRTRPDSAPIRIFLNRYYAPSPGALIPGAYADEARDLVSKADRQGIACAAASGYDPEPYLEALQKLPSPSATSHPPSASRIAAAHEVIVSLMPRSSYVVSSHEFDAIRWRVGQLYSPGRQRAGLPPSLHK